MKRSLETRRTSTTLHAIAASLVLFACGEGDSTTSAKEAAPPAKEVAPPAKEVAPPVKEAQPPAKEVKEPGATPVTPAREVPLPASLLETKAEVAQAKAQIDLTTAKLQILAASTEDELEEPYEGFVDSVEKLHANAAGLVERGDAMRERGAAYFQEWEDQMSKMATTTVKDVATKRKDELASAYAAVLAKMQEARAAYDAYDGSLEEIQSALEEDLDPATLKGLAGRFKTAKEQAATLTTRLDGVLETIDKVAVIFTRK